MSSALQLQGRFVQPTVVTSHFHLREGDVVADYGAGSGFFTEALSQVVGRNGKVFACEIQKELVEKIGDVVRTKGLHNVDVKWCDIEDPSGVPISDGQLDAAVLINTFFQFENKAAGLQEIMRTLRPGGKFLLVDWSDSFGGVGPHPNDVVLEDAARAFAESVGFTYERSFDAGDHHYGLAFRKP